jgi:hypothetical protein
MRKVLRTSKGGFLPSEFDLAHDFCFVLHDLMANALVYGEKSGAFLTRLALRDKEDAEALEAAEDVFAWLEATRSIEERVTVLTKSVFPAVFSDALHFVYEALESSRKAKLNVTYALLRKPIQENLFVLESIVLDKEGFAGTLATDPLKLRAQKQGGRDSHLRRIQSVLEALEMTEYFSADYLAQLRYSKVEDGFDGACNHAMHLFTEHEAIRTEPLNINFVFSGWEEKMSQWSFLYSRLPYVLSYAHAVAEYAVEGFAKTAPEYLDMARRRIAALTLLWYDEVPQRYRADPLQCFVDATRGWLVGHCNKGGWRIPTQADLERMAETGATPGQSWISLKLRDWRFERQARRTV